MNDAQLQRTVRESMRQGHARILDHSLVLDRDRLILAVVGAQAGIESSRNAVVNGMSQLVYRLAYDYMRKWQSHLPAHASFDDVFGEGLAGLQRGVRDYDPDSDNAFTTYATWWIRNGVQSAIYDLAGGGSIRAKALVKGVSPIDPLVGNSVLSLDKPLGEAGEAFHVVVPGPVDEEMDVDLIVEILDLLTAVDPHLPEIVNLVDRKHAVREIARIVGLPYRRVEELLKQAQQVVRDAGLA